MSIKFDLLMEASFLTPMYDKSTISTDKIAGGIEEPLTADEKLGFFFGNASRRIAAEAVPLTLDEYIGMLEAINKKSDEMKHNPAKYNLDEFFKTRSDEWLRDDDLTYLAGPKSLFAKGEPIGLRLPIVAVNMYQYAKEKGVLEEVNMTSSSVRKFIESVLDTIGSGMLMASKELSAENEIYAKTMNATCWQANNTWAIGAFNTIKYIINVNSKYLR